MIKDRHGRNPITTHEHFVETAMDTIWFNKINNIDEAYKLLLRDHIVI